MLQSPVVGKKHIPHPQIYYIKVQHHRYINWLVIIARKAHVLVKIVQRIICPGALVEVDLDHSEDVINLLVLQLINHRTKRTKNEPSQLLDSNYNKYFYGSNFW